MTQATQALTAPDRETSLTGLLLPLADRTLLLPNVLVAELIAYSAPHVSPDMPDWFLGQVAWRELSLPLLSFEAASTGRPQAAAGSGAQVAVLNAAGGRAQVKFIALLLQGIPRSIKLGADLQRADTPLAALELEAVSLAGKVLKIPDLPGLEQLLADAGLI